MKHSRRLSFLLFICFAFLTSCGTDEEVNLITINNSNLELDGAGDTEIIVLSSTAISWTASSSDEWCVISPQAGEKKIGSITVTADPNLTFISRQAIITISAPNAEDVMVTITQGIPEGLDLLALSESEVKIDSENTNFTVTLNSTTTNWTISNHVDWVTFDPKTGELGEYVISISVEKNTGAERTSYLTFSGNASGDIKLKITQAAAPYPTYSIPIEADRSHVENNALTLASKISLGWNLGNSMEVPSGETAWGNPKTTKAFIDKVKESGFNAVRIPCSWNSYIENRVTCKIKDSWLSRVKEVVDYCIDNEMYVIVNIHWDGGWLEENPVYSKQVEVNAKQKALWEQIAMYFRDYDEHLLFAGTNEVHKGYGNPSTENIEVQMSFNQTFVDAVRSTGGRNAYRNLIVQAYNTNINLAFSKLEMPVDETQNRLMAEVHYYDPWDYCGENSSSTSARFYWGKEGGYTTGISSWGQEDDVRKQFAKMKSKFVDKGYPVILGEYGAVNRTSALSTAEEKLEYQKSRAYYLYYVTQKMKENGMVPFYWDNGHTGIDGFAIFNRKNNSVFDQTALDALVTGAANGKYPF